MTYSSFICVVYILSGIQAVTGEVVKIAVPEVIVQAGKSAKIIVHVSVEKGYHIQANKVNDEFIIPTTLEINTDEILLTEEQVFPESKKFRLEGTTDSLPVYDGDFKISIPIRVREKVKKGKYNLAAKLRYQACDNKTCFFPKTVAFSFTIRIV